VPRLLIVAAIYPPSRKIGARRPERFARHLAARGWDVTVLTLHPGYNPPNDDERSTAAGVEVVRSHAFVPGNLLRAASELDHRRRARDRSGHSQTSGDGAPGISRRLRDALWRNLSRVEFPDRWIGWTPFALAAVARREFDAVLATLPPYSAALIARRIARRCGAVLALDYRDPWTEAPRVDWNPAHYRHLLGRHRRVEDDCLREADVVFATSPTLCRWLAPRAGIEPVFAPNSFDERHEPVPAGTRSQEIVYSGSLAYGRSLSPILAAMSRQATAGTAAVKLTYAGSDGARLTSEAARLGLSDRVTDLGYLPAREAERLVRHALAAVVIVTPGYEYMLPAKLFEILASGTPILLIAPADSDVAAMCRELRLGWHHVPEDVDGIVASLRRAAAGESPSPVGLEALQTHSVIESVDAALRQALEKGRRG
jgi:glycosyltransferase involved in cell wall biosynthesis